jgi:hypothetical protein
LLLALQLGPSLLGHAGEVLAQPPLRLRLLAVVSVTLLAGPLLHALVDQQPEELVQQPAALGRLGL